MICEMKSLLMACPPPKQRHRHFRKISAEDGQKILILEMRFKEFVRKCHSIENVTSLHNKTAVPL